MDKVNRFMKDEAKEMYGVLIAYYDESIKPYTGQGQELWNQLTSLQQHLANKIAVFNDVLLTADTTDCITSTIWIIKKVEDDLGMAFRIYKAIQEGKVSFNEM